jgi:hypothetical protein
MKTLSRDEMKKVFGGYENPIEGTSKCCITTNGVTECTQCVHDGGINCSTAATRVVCTTS